MINNAFELIAGYHSENKKHDAEAKWNANAVLCLIRRDLVQLQFFPTEKNGLNYYGSSLGFPQGFIADHAVIQNRNIPDTVTNQPLPVVYNTEELFNFLQAQSISINAAKAKE